MTTAQAQRTEAMMKEYAQGESVKIEEIGGTLYVFGSELATLRIFAKYLANGSVQNPKARVGYSQNLQSNYFSLDMIFNS
jgi:hypothetical protein